MEPIYFDYMATTPLDPKVIHVMTECLQENFGNASSQTHCYGWRAAAAIDKARQQVAALVNADPIEITWTSGATEAINLAILGAAHFYQRKGKHIITSKTEHKAVLDSCHQLEREGFEVTYLTPQSNGLLDISEIGKAIRPDTILISIMHVNNEIGVIQDIDAIANLTHKQGILLHIDAAQSAGKLPIDLKKCSVDLMSFSAHKCYGPKGIGALFVRRKPRVHLQTMSFGGGQEGGLRSGTLATHQIVGMGEAFAIAQEIMADEQRRILNLRTRLWHGIQSIPGVTLNGDWEQRVPGNLNVSVADVDGDSLVLSLKDLAISSTSACSSASIEPSHVLRAIGVPSELAHSSIRLAIGRFTKESDVEFAVKIIHEQVKRLREMAP